MRQTVAFFTDTLGNRYPSTKGDTLSRLYISRHFSNCGLESHEQTFDIIESNWGHGTMHLVNEEGIKHFIEGQDFTVRGDSKADTLSAEYVVVVGTLPDSLHYLMCNKVVICQLKSERGITPTWRQVEQAGGLAYLCIQPPGVRMVEPSKKGNNRSRPRIPILSLNHTLFNDFLPQNIANISSGNIYLAPSSARINIVTQHYEKRIQGANVIGFKRGTDPCAKYIIVGAHYDALSPDTVSGQLRRGANDNASDVAVLMALAEQLSVVTTQHNIVFVAFGAEEKGLLGSRNFVEQMPFGRNEILEMINLDMVGRMEDGILHYYQANNPRFKPADILRQMPRYGIKMVNGPDCLSDHYYFVNIGVPVSYFHTGPDPMIHSTGDTSERLNYEGMADIVDFLTCYILGLE